MRIIFFILIFIYGCFSAVFNFLFPNPAVAAVRENLDLNIKPYYVEFHEDNRGWFGDGEELVIFTPNPDQMEKIREEWNKTPIESRIYSLIFPKTEYNGLELAKHLPENGSFWFFKDRSPEGCGYFANFSFAVFDGEKVYYYELDT